MAKIPVIKAVNLTKEFELGAINVQALTGVNLEIYSGEFIIFFGPSGCGKSTLMSMIAGLQPPSKGQILIRGEDLSKMNDDELAAHRRTKIGMVFQAFNLISTMNVVENIALPLAFARIPKSKRMARAESLLDVVGMSEYKNHTPSELSGGQQQRIAVARSLVANPWIMLADEPTGNLDSKAANDVMRLLISLNRKSKRTIVLITHNPDYLEYADRIFYVRDGKIVDTKVNSKVKSMEEVDAVGKIRDDLNPGAKEDSKKSKAEEDSEAEKAETEEVIEEEKTEKGKKGKKIEKPKEEAEGEEAPETESVTENTADEVPAEALGDDVPAEEPEDIIVDEKEKSKKSKKEKLKPMKLGS